MNEKTQARLFDLDDDTYKKISGNASPEVKKQLWQAITLLIKHGQGLDDIMGRHVSLLSADMQSEEEWSGRNRSLARVVSEVEVEDGEQHAL